MVEPLRIKLSQRIDGKEFAMDMAITPGAIEHFGTVAITETVEKMYRAIQNAGKELSDEKLYHVIDDKLERTTIPFDEALGGFL